MIEVKDEILTDEPRYVIRNSNGQVIEEDVTIEMTTPVIQEGTALNKDLFEIAMPSGLICMWSGSVVPRGWFLCNGENGTPDLRDRFIVGAGSSYNVGDKGGTNSVTLESSNLPSHTHQVKIYADTASRSTNITDQWDQTGDRNGSILGLIGPDDTEVKLCIPAKNNSYTEQETHYDFTITTTANSTNNLAHENRPPYYALAFIMKA